MKSQTQEIPAEDERGEEDRVSTEPQAPDQFSLPLDEIFGILRNQRRRDVLKILFEEGGPVRLGELAEQIAAWENGKDVHEINSSERKRVYVGLYQAHLPKMDSMDVIDFNKPRGIIEPGENISAFQKYIDQGEKENEVSWERWYGAVSLIGGFAFLFTLLLDSILTIPIIHVGFSLVVLLFAGVTIMNIAWLRKHDSSTESLVDES